MGAVRRPRGRLPRRVYWARRSALVGIVAVLVLGVVVGVARLTGGTGVDPAADQVARTSGDTAESAPSPPPARVLGPQRAVEVDDTQDTAPVAPTGPCSPRDVRAVPVLDAPEAGSRVVVGVELTGTQPACTFEVSPSTLVVKIVDEEGRDFWRSQVCEDVVPTEDVVVRSATPTTVEVRWNARASARGCGDYDRWAMPGFFDALASVQGSTPERVRFELLPPSVRYVTETPEPEPEPETQEPETQESESEEPAAG